MQRNGRSGCTSSVMECARCSRDQNVGVAPDLLTVSEIVVILRISRTKVYELASEWRRTDGEFGLRSAFVGGQIRFPRVAIEEIAGGPLTWPPVIIDPFADDPDLERLPTVAGHAAPRTRRDARHAEPRQLRRA